jgi:outer membrane protein OmpA-like peptidoglycan-associated protein
MAAQRDEQALSSPDRRLAEALGPTVAAALKSSVRDEPEVWAAAFVPVLAPAIRMAVTSALVDAVETLNQVLEHALSLRSWRWRIEAWRTGRSFAEVVLLRTLIYRVEQVLLVDRNSGLLLTSVSAPGISVKDQDLISGMLIAIQDFVRDSFQLDQNENIREIRAGDFSIWVEPGPQAALVAVVRGSAPVELRERLRSAIALIHEKVGTEIRAFEGDSKSFEEICRCILEGCLQSRSQRKRPASWWRLWLCLAVVSIALAFWGALQIWHAWQWNKAMSDLRAIPGITITRSTEAKGKHVLEGFRDPYAMPAESVLARDGIPPGDVSTNLQPFLSLDPKLVARRARAMIQAPDSVSMSVDKDVLKLAGTASHAWIVSARNSLPKLAFAGIREVSTNDLEDKELEFLQSDIEAARILFGSGSSVITPHETRLVDHIAVELRDWRAEALAIGRTPRAEVIGHEDSSRGDQANSELSGERARRVLQMLITSGIPADSLTVFGTRPYPGREGVAAPLERNVELRLILDPDAAGRGRH